MIQVRRVYDPPSPDDGYRVLVDRLWPRGMRKDDLVLDAWLKDIAPSTELRKAYHGERVDFDRFARSYREELEGSPEANDLLLALREKARTRTVTLLTASRSDQSHAHVLGRLLTMERGT